MTPFAPKEFLNDKLNDCTIVALANSARYAYWVKSGGLDLAITDEMVAEEFAGLAKVAPTLAAEEAVAGLFPADVFTAPVAFGDPPLVIGWPFIRPSSVKPGDILILNLETGDLGVTGPCSHAVMAGDSVALTNPPAGYAASLFGRRVASWGKWYEVQLAWLKTRLQAVYRPVWNLPAVAPAATA